MFTGIVTSTGLVQEKTPVGGDVRLLISAGQMNFAGCREGDSIAVSGTCLTMLQPAAHSFSADVSAETLQMTTLGSVGAGQRVNLELAMTLADRLGGHLVTGHVDGIARLRARRPDGRAERFEFELPAGLEKYVARKGSVCVDGVSLTVNDQQGRIFSVCLIPHTLEITTLGDLQPGSRVNIEVDLIARYVERLARNDESL
jgi:riboflavin synthase